MASLRETLLAIQRGAQLRRMKSYRTFLIVVLILFAFFCTSKIWMPDTGTVTSTEMGTTISTSTNISLTLRDWQYNPSTGYMETTFDVDESSYVYTSSLQFIVKLFSDNSRTTPLDCSIAYVDEDTLICSMQNLPKGWQVLSLRIGDNTADLKVAATGTLSSSASSQQPAQTDETPARFNCDIRTISQNTALEPKTESAYAMQSILRHIQAQKDLIAQYQQQIDANNDTIQSLQNDIVGIQQEQVYQLENERDQSNTAIADKQKQIGTLQTKNDEYQTDIDACNAKIEMLNKKLSDLQNGTTPTQPVIPQENNEAVSSLPSASSEVVSQTSSTPAASSEAPVSSEITSSQPAVSSAVPEPVSSTPTVVSEAPMESEPVPEDDAGVTYEPIE